jgi:multidrug resistance protein, MATE family
MLMNTVDIIMVGQLGPEAIGAIGVGGNAFYCLAIFGIGLLFGLDTLVSQSHGAGNRSDTHHSLAQGVYAAFLIAVPLMVVFQFLPPIFDLLKVNPAVSVLAGPFLLALSWSTLPLLLYGAFRRYLQGIGHVRPVMFALISANIVNWLFNWLLIPKLGVVGSALSTCLARVYMAGTLLFFIWWYERGYEAGFRSLLRKPDLQRMARLLGIGLPAATQILLEIGAFGAAGILAARLAPTALAAHQTALSCAAVAYMVPLGISSAAAVAVGQAVGRGEPTVARRSGFIALGLAVAFMASTALGFWFFPRPILRIYTNDAGVIESAVALLAIAALFQLFDGVQTVATGALRGIGETRVPMLVNLGGYWMFGLPVGYLLCFHAGRGVTGLWWGLTLALVAIALTLLYAWEQRSRKIPAYIFKE